MGFVDNTYKGHISQQTKVNLKSLENEWRIWIGMSPKRTISKQAPEEGSVSSVTTGMQMPQETFPYPQLQNLQRIKTECWQVRTMTHPRQWWAWCLVQLWKIPPKLSRSCHVAKHFYSQAPIREATQKQIFTEDGNRNIPVLQRSGRIMSINRNVFKNACYLHNGIFSDGNHSTTKVWKPKTKRRQSNPKIYLKDSQGLVRWPSLPIKPDRHKFHSLKQ